MCTRARFRYVSRTPGLGVDGIDERQHLGDHRVEFARDDRSDVELGERFDQARILMQRDAVLARERRRSLRRSDRVRSR